MKELTCVRRCIAAFPDRNWSVLELGAYNGRNTVPLSRFYREVHATEPRYENRRECQGALSVAGLRANLTSDRADDMSHVTVRDLLFHAGVFYHLEDPVSHWRSLAGRFQHVWFNTHYAPPGAALHGRSGDYDCYAYAEGDGPRSGMGSRSMWLTRPDLLQLVSEQYDCDVTWEQLDCEHGPRIELRCVLRGDAC